MIVVECLISFQLINIVLYLIFIMWRKKKKHESSSSYCVLIAHPDDEVLFFGPTILNLVATGHRIHVLCLSNGDYYGLGKRREVELRNSCRRLSPSITVEIQTRFQDHPTLEWNAQELEYTITDYLRTNKVQNLITFDKDGVSSHINHRSLFEVIPKLKESSSDLVVYSLKTCFLIRKYLFLFDLVWTLLIDLKCSNNNKRNLVFVNSLRDYYYNVMAMLEHRSQLLWFRYLYIISSRYMFINYLELVE